MDFVDITECVIDITGRISVTARGEVVPESDDEYYYLFAMNTYDEEISPDSDYLSRDYKDNEVTLTTALNYNTANSQLYKKFVIAIKADGEYVQISKPEYITNPEAIAGYTSVFQEPDMAAVGTFLANRYSDNKHGKISNWIIANEINAHKEWNYMEYTDIETYVEEYAKAFRVFYTSIKSVSSSARVYISLDQQWDRNLKNSTNYDGRDILDVFNENITSKGNLDWGVAFHPYNVPLTETKVWKSSRDIKNDAGTSMISMANIEVLIDYLHQEDFLTGDGEVRSILISELGYTSSGGEAYQAAAFAYAYYKIAAYDDIDGFLLNRETDAEEEMAQGLAFGISNIEGKHKQIYNVFKYIDTPEHEKYTDFAKDLIGISSWDEIMQ